MKILILAAGYGTRLYPLTLNKPKPLLEVGKKTMMAHIIDKLEKVKEVSEGFVVTNQKFYPGFDQWSRNIKSRLKIDVINDGTLNNDDRLGAIGDIQLVIKSKNINDDLLVIGGDNLFEDPLDDFVDFANSKSPYCVVVLRDVKDKIKAKKYGIVQIDRENRILDFQEKPKKPKSTLAAGCIYMFPKEKLGLFYIYLSEGNSKDAPGNFISWLSKREPVYGYIFKKEWFDIGDMDSLEKARKKFI